MYKLLIVDDKAIIRKGLIQMIDWPALQVELFGEAENGEKAMQIIKDTKPDIIVTDIKMPVMDGIALLKEVHSTYPDIKTIVISGYDEFEYARQAIKSGSVDYLLKPIDPVDLNESIKKCIQMIYESKPKKESDLENKQLTEVLYRLLHNFGGIAPGVAHIVDYFSKKYNAFCVTIIRCEGVELKSTICANLPGYTGNLDTYFIDTAKELITIFCACSTMGTDLLETRIISVLNNFIGTLDEPSPRICAGVGKVCENLSELNSSYDTAREVMIYSLLTEVNFIEGVHLLQTKKLSHLPVNDYEDRLTVSLTSGNVKEVKSILENTLKKGTDSKDVSMVNIRLLLADLCHILLKSDNSMASEIQKFMKDINSPDYLLNFGSWDNIKKIILNLYELTAKKFLEGTKSKESVVMRIKDFIENNYSSEIGLEEIAVRFHMNASYLSNLFKKEVGENINGYITRTRIQKAQRLLAEGNVKTAQVAQMVGYADYTYFHKVFKKVTGMTPKEYTSR